MRVYNEYSRNQYRREYRAEVYEHPLKMRDRAEAIIEEIQQELKDHIRGVEILQDTKCNNSALYAIILYLLQRGILE